MTLETDFESSLSGRPNPVSFVKTLTGPLHWSAVEREISRPHFSSSKYKITFRIFNFFGPSVGRLSG